MTEIQSRLKLTVALMLFLKEVLSRGSFVVKFQAACQTSRTHHLWIGNAVWSSSVSAEIQRRSDLEINLTLSCPILILHNRLLEASSMAISTPGPRQCLRRARQRMPKVEISPSPFCPGSTGPCCMIHLRKGCVFGSHLMSNQFWALAQA